MSKKSTGSEKKLLKEMLEEEELLLDALDATDGQIKKIKPIRPKTKIKKQIRKRKKRVELLRHLMQEGKKVYTKADEKEVSLLLSRVPKKKTRESAYSKRERAEEVHHKHELQTALDHYPRVHMLRLLKITVFIFMLLAILLFFIVQSDLFQMTGLIAAIG